MAAEVFLSEFDKKDYHSQVNFSYSIKLFSMLSFPSLVQYIGYSPIDFDGSFRPVIITDYQANKTLADIIDFAESKKKLKGWDNTKKLMNIYGIASAMAFLHSHNIVQRFLTPSNILIDEYLLPKVKIANWLGFNNDDESTKENDPLFQSRIGFGNIDFDNIAYLPPEYYEKGNYTKASDVFCFCKNSY